MGYSVLAALVSFYLAWRFWNAQPVEPPPPSLANLTPEQGRRKIRTGALLLALFGILSVAWALWLFVKRGV